MGVLDSGVNGAHPHFARYKNLDVVTPLRHRDYTGIGSPLKDAFGHGTHVAGIIAASLTAVAAPGKKIVAVARHRDEEGEVQADRQELTEITGMAPKCKLVSLKVLDDNGQGEASSLLAAIDEIQRVNGFGRNIRIHGVNLSVGYGFEPEWFACGQSPVCVEIDLLVRSGVVVVVRQPAKSGWDTMKTRFVFNISFKKSRSGITPWQAPDRWLGKWV